VSGDIGGGPPNGLAADASSADASALADAATVPDGPLPDARACLEGDRRTIGADGTCYFGFNTPDTWPNARNTCIANAGDLIRIDSSAENDLVFALAREAPIIDDDWWVGGNDLQTENVWVWQDDVQEMRGTLFTQFRAGEPNDNDGSPAGEDCMIIETDNGNEEWDDRNCTTRLYPYVCERAAN
jgi:hypothetical protein